MGHIKEPPGIDLNVGPMPLSEEDRQLLSAVIAEYKNTKEVPKSKPKFAKKEGIKGAESLQKKNGKTTAKSPK